MGLSIFTKIPAFFMVPLVAFLISGDSNHRTTLRRWKYVALWLFPAILIPLIWPAYATLIGHLDGWIGGVWFQTHRTGAGLLYSLNYNFKVDALFMIAGFAGLVYSAFRRDFFILLWAIPLLIFFYFIGFVSFWHIIPLIPVFCIGSSYDNRIVKDTV